MRIFLMINLLTNLSIFDNSGAKSGIMIKRLEPKTSTKNSPARVGHVIGISIRKVLPNTKKIKRKSVYQALIIRTKKVSNLFSSYFFKQNYPYKTGLFPIEYYLKKNRKKNRLGGHSISWNDNAAILIKISKSDYQPIGTRIKGPICKSLKMQKGCLKIVSISKNN